MKKLVKTTTLGAALVTALLPLACCWGPTLLAGVAVLSGVATEMAWLHPYESWLYAFSFSILGYSHFKNYREKQTAAADCRHCTPDNRQADAKNFTTPVLWLATALVALMFLVNQFPRWFI